MTQDDLKRTVQQHGQEHVLRYTDSCTSEEAAELFAQLREIDWRALPEWLATYVHKKPDFHLPDDLEPAPFYPVEPEDDAQRKLYADADACGWQLLRDGKVAAFTVAGGQGTRLGFDGPKGTFPVGPITRKSLFQWFAESLLRWGERAGKTIPWYIMTSPMNDTPTRDYFAENQYFGLAPEDVTFFPQGVMPAFSYDGKLLLADKCHLAIAPDGHGGSLKALSRSGALDDMKRRGIEHVSYFQVDNPLVSVVNPRFLGLHHLTGSEMSSRSLPKSGPHEKIGAFCRSEGRLLIVEYSDLPDRLAEATDENGRLRYLAGSPAIHVLRRSFVERLNQGGSFQLPFHRADKKIPYLDADGKLVQPSEANGVKLETFVFDALPLAEKPIVVEALREDEFAPVKNATGVDSIVSSRRLMQERFARWLTARGIDVPRDRQGELACALEISPRRYVTEDDFAADSRQGLFIAPSESIYYS